MDLTRRHRGRRLLGGGILLVPMLLIWAAGTAGAEEDDPVALGGKLVEHLGCLFCHGLGGREGIINPNAAERKYIPAWDEREFIERYPEPDEVKKTIREGRFPERAADATSNPIPMPPWGNRLSEQEVDAIVAYIWDLRGTPLSSHPQGGRGAEEAKAAYEKVVAAPRPAPKVEEEEHEHMAPDVLTDNARAERGKELVSYLGCLHCHGVGEHQGMENPNAVRKHVPAWDDPEFIDRYKVDDGIRWVITKGRIPEKDPEADGTPVPMPPFAGRISDQDLDDIVSYIWGLRTTKTAHHHH